MNLQENIRRILKEETEGINEFDWASEIKPSTGKDVTTSGLNLLLVI
jgi:hypothetical protein